MKKNQRIPGGLAEKKKPCDFDQNQLAKGIKIELEHTSDPLVAREIAMDHLMEDPKYYTHLIEMEEKYEGKHKKMSSSRKNYRKSLIRLAMQSPKLSQTALLLLRKDYGTIPEEKDSNLSRGLCFPRQNQNTPDKIPHKQKILELFRQSEIVDEDVHQLAKELGIEEDQLENEIYEMLRQMLTVVSGAI